MGTLNRIRVIHTWPYRPNEDEQNLWLLLQMERAPEGLTITQSGLVMEDDGSWTTYVEWGERYG